MTQYLLPSVIELAYVHCTTSSSKYNSTYMIKCINEYINKYILTIITAIFIIFFSFRGMLLTCMFFHTGLESFTAICIVLLFVIIPLYYCVNSSYFINMIVSRSGLSSRGDN